MLCRDEAAVHGKRKIISSADSINIEQFSGDVQIFLQSGFIQICDLREFYASCRDLCVPVASVSGDGKTKITQREQHPLPKFR